MLTRFERARVLSARALQLALGAPPLIDVPEGVVDPYFVAKKELEAGVLPFVVIREYPDGRIERIEVS